MLKIRKVALSARAKLHLRRIIMTVSATQKVLFFLLHAGRPTAHRCPAFSCRRSAAADSGAGRIRPRRLCWMYASSATLCLCFGSPWTAVATGRSWFRCGSVTAAFRPARLGGCRRAGCCFAAEPLPPVAPRHPFLLDPRQVAVAVQDAQQEGQKQVQWHADRPYANLRQGVNKRRRHARMV